MRKSHAISYDWQGFHPHLSVYDVEAKEIGDFNFWDLGFNVSHRSFCVGNWNGQGYSPCPTSESVSGGSLCGDCASSFLPDLNCMFEPRCDGEACDMDFCSREHTVYLAFHGRIAKIGMTSSARLKQRMIEQGADAYSVIAKVQGRKTARTMESALADRLTLRQRVRGIESLAGLAEGVPVKDIEQAFTEVAGSIEGFGHKLSPLRFLDGYPINQPLRKMPREAKAADEHSGRVVGVKGKFLIYENGGLKALNMQTLPGRHITDSLANPSKPLECWQ